MAWNNEEERRIQAIENGLAKQTAALNGVASKKQLNQILALLTKEINALKQEIQSLKAQINALTNS